MKGTEQFNIRLPNELLADLNLICQILHVNKTEWVKTKIGELVHKEKIRLLNEVKELVDRRLISKSQIKKLREVIR